MAVLDAAGRLFREKGWGATTIAAVARAAKVSPETIYARFGNKKTIAHQLIVRAMRGDDQQTPFMQQARRANIEKMSDGGALIDGFSADVSGLLTQVAPILAVIRSAAERDAEMAELYADLHQTRRRNLRGVILALERLGALRRGLDVEAATDSLWSLVSPELWLLRIEQCGATPESNREWLRASLRRLLLD
jgi:AcrR family transcriptional regulator